MEKPNNLEQAQEIAIKTGLEIKDVIRVFKVPVPKGTNYSSELERAVESENFSGINWVCDNALNDDIRSKALKAREEYCKKKLDRATEPGEENFGVMMWVHNNTLDRYCKDCALIEMEKYHMKMLNKAANEKNISFAWWVHDNTTNDGIKNKAIRNIVLLAK